MVLKIIIYAAIGLVSAAIGSLLTRYFIFRDCAGVLREDHSDPDEAPYLFLELKQEGLLKIQTKKYVVFKVLRENYIPRE